MRLHFRMPKTSDMLSAPTTVAFVLCLSVYMVNGHSVAPRTAPTAATPLMLSTDGSARQPLETSARGQAGSAEQARCELPALPPAARRWAPNETHELRLPRVACAVAGAGGAAEQCTKTVASWEGCVDVQSGDDVIVRIADASPAAPAAWADPPSRRERAPQPAVYQVTRQAHERCDVSEGVQLDVAALRERAAQLITLRDKDLTAGVNLLLVVAENWEPRCVRLAVTVKSDNCGASQLCSSHGACYTDESMDVYECRCCAGFAGPLCEQKVACATAPCLNGGVCIDHAQPLADAGFSCLCPYGFTGRLCELEPCFSSPCLNGGSCVSHAADDSTAVRCVCAAAWTGARCETPSAGRVCESRPCLKGICVEQADADEKPGYRCFCEPGYTGERCELEYNECDSSPCAHGGTCTDRVAGFNCACGRGYGGPTCQVKVDLCLPQPCGEQQVCVDRGNSYSCECPRGYVGAECHAPASSICDTNPCAHGGSCWSGVDSFYCSCRPGYTGRLCEEDFIVEPVMEGDSEERGGARGGVRVLRLPLGLYRDRLHNVLIAAGTLGAAVAIVGVVVTACHCRVHKPYARLLAALATAGRGPRPPPPLPPSAPLHATDLYCTLDLSDNQTSPLIQ